VSSQIEKNVGWGCCRFPYIWFLPVLTAIQLGLFAVCHLSPEIVSKQVGDHLELRHYSPGQGWRFFLYSLVYTSPIQLSFDLARQVMVGFPLELVYGTGRVFLVFSSALFSSALFTCLFEPASASHLSGSSSGCNSLVVGMLLNWIAHKQASPSMWIKTISLIVLVSADLGIALFNKETSEEAAGYSQFATGALTGATIGFAVFSTYEQKLKEQRKWWIMIGLELAVLFALLIIVLMGKNKRFIY
jgi:membrane associated rhomboid family serine protease